MNLLFVLQEKKIIPNGKINFPHLVQTLAASEKLRSLSTWVSKGNLDGWINLRWENVGTRWAPTMVINGRRTPLNGLKK